jgi:hypothetical protein
LDDKSAIWALFLKQPHFRPRSTKVERGCLVLSQPLFFPCDRFFAPSLLYDNGIGENEGGCSGDGLAVAVGASQAEGASIAQLESNAGCKVSDANDREVASGQGIDIGTRVRDGEG